MIVLLLVWFVFFKRFVSHCLFLIFFIFKKKSSVAWMDIDVWPMVGISNLPETAVAKKRDSTQANARFIAHQL